MTSPITNIGKDSSMSTSEREAMFFDLGGAQPLYDGLEHAYVLRQRGDIVARGKTVKECYFRYKGWCK